MSGGSDGRGSTGPRLIAAAAGRRDRGGRGEAGLRGPEPASAGRHQDLVPDQPPG